MPTIASSNRPFLRWAGGKRWLVRDVRALIGQTEFATYHEPFLGGGAMFLGLAAGRHAHLGDLNADLIATYETVRRHPSAVAEALSCHENTEEYYYELRNAVPDDCVAQAARFIFLNHTSYNGVYRVNLRGQYNVPYGGGRVARLPSETELRGLAEVLACVELHVRDFEVALAAVEPGDFVFLDPPYTVAHNHNGFVKYNDRLFSFADQMRLSKAIDGVKERGAFYAMTNAAHASIRELFDKGDRCIETRRKNAVGGSRATRGTAVELLFTNLPLHD